MALDRVLTVLLVEDDPDMAELFQFRLGLEGYEVVVATDGVSGFLKARMTRPDLIFLDLRLPKMDGFRVLEMLRQEEGTSQTPVVILSNYGEGEFIRRGLQLGAMDYLIKSETTPSKLAEMVGNLTKTS